MPNTIDKESFIKKLTEIINSNIRNEQFGVNELAREMGMSRSNLHRKVKSYTGKSVSAFICDIKLDKAIQLLKESSGTMSEIAFECGFNSTTYFSKCFKDRYGFPPGEAKSRMHEIEIPDNPGNQREKKGFAKKRISIFYFISALLIIILFTIVVFIWRPFDEAKGGKYIIIAVLPFINDSPDQSEMYFINGTMVAILNNLSKIEALSVIPRTSVEPYRNNPKPTKVVADELNVRYILIGSGMKQGDRIFLNLQLVDAKKDKYIWSESYEKSIDEVFELYSDIAQRIAKKVEATVTPTEKQLIERNPTKSKIAYDLYLKGLDMNPYTHKGQYGTNIEILNNKETIYRIALGYDSTFASLYVEIGFIYLERIKNTGNKPPDQLDTVRHYIEKALYFDNQLSTAYLLRGYYHNLLGDTEKAITDFNQALGLDPNDTRALDGLAWNYVSIHDYQNALDCLHKNEKVDRGRRLEYTLHGLRQAYLFSGCYDQFIRFNKNLLAISHDSAEYFFSLGLSEYIIKNNALKAIEFLKQGLASDPDNLKILGGLSMVYYDLGRYEDALRVVEMKNAKLRAENIADIYQAFLAGFIYKKNGAHDMANFYFDQQIRFCESMSGSLKGMHMQMAMAYSGKEEKDEALENLRILNQMERMGAGVLKNLQDDDFFECIQDDPEFKEIRKELIAKYEAEHQRVMRWLEEKQETER